MNGLNTALKHSKKTEETLADQYQTKGKPPTESQEPAKARSSTAKTRVKRRHIVETLS
jgi:hypothetical protein